MDCKEIATDQAMLAVQAESIEELPYSLVQGNFNKYKNIFKLKTPCSIHILCFVFWFQFDIWLTGTVLWLFMTGEVTPLCCQPILTMSTNKGISNKIFGHQHSHIKLYWNVPTYWWPQVWVSIQIFRKFYWGAWRKNSHQFWNMCWNES